MSIWNHADDISTIPDEARVTLGEGDTPLVRSRRIGPAAGLGNLYYKLETTNPSGSYKDRFAAVAISDMVARRQSLCLATSSGNTGAALAAYSAAAGIDCAIAVLETTPSGKLSQMLAYGARIYAVQGFGPDGEITAGVFRLLQELAEARDDSAKISAFCYNPVGMSGVPTLSFELAQQAADNGFAVDHVFAPAGGGGLVLALALGFERLAKSSRLPSVPHIHCVQPAGNDTMAGPLRDGHARARSVDCTTRISGLQVPSVLDGDQVITHCRASGGTGHVVSDESIWDAQRRLAREEGIFCEPAGAAALAGVLDAADSLLVDPQSHIVCLVTGSGFKDPSSIDRMNQGVTVPRVSLSQLAGHLQQA